MTNLENAPVNQASKCTKLLEKYKAQKQVVKEQLSKMLSEASL